MPGLPGPAHAPCGIPLSPVRQHAGPLGRDPRPLAVLRLPQAGERTPGHRDGRLPPQPARLVPGHRTPDPRAGRNDRGVDGGDGDPRQGTVRKLARKIRQARNAVNASEQLAGLDRFFREPARALGPAAVSAPQEPYFLK